MKFIDLKLEKWHKKTKIRKQLQKQKAHLKNNIGLRLQSRLTKDQAIFVAKCNSIHRDISLNF